MVTTRRAIRKPVDYKTAVNGPSLKEVVKAEKQTQTSTRKRTALTSRLTTKNTSPPVAKKSRRLPKSELVESKVESTTKVKAESKLKEVKPAEKVKPVKKPVKKSEIIYKSDPGTESESEGFSSFDNTSDDSDFKVEDGDFEDESSRKKRNYRKTTKTTARRKNSKNNETLEESFHKINVNSNSSTDESSCESELEEELDDLKQNNKSTRSNRNYKNLPKLDDFIEYDDPKYLAEVRKERNSASVVGGWGGDCKTFEETVLMLINRRINKNLKSAKEDVHKTHLLTLVHLGKKFEKLSRNELIQGLILSKLPEDIKFEDFKNNFLPELKVDFKNSDDSRFYETNLVKVLHAITTGKISNYFELTIIISVCLRIFGKTIRIALDLEPLPFKDLTKVQSKAKSKEYSEKLKDVGASFLRTWIEIHDENEQKWSVFEFNDSMEPSEYQPKLIFHPPTGLAPNPAYIFAFSENYQRDVTASYAENWLTSTRKLRVASFDKDWFKHVAVYLEKNYDADLKNQENFHLQTHLLSKPLPKTVAEYKNHPLFVLEKQLLQCEVFYPKKVEPLKDAEGNLLRVPKTRALIFPRSCVKIVKNESKWRQDGRSIKLGEKPYKFVSGFRGSKVGAYGKWQTEKYRKGVVGEDGKFKKFLNKYGNIEIYNENMVPVNSVWLKSETPDGNHFIGLKTVAGLIGVDVAPVMVGWEKGTARPTPRFEGWLVYDGNVEKLMKAYEGEHSDVVNIELEEKGRKDAEEAEKRKFPCQYCGKRMTKAEYRKVHIQKKHPGKKFN